MTAQTSNFPKRGQRALEECWKGFVEHSRLGLAMTVMGLLGMTLVAIWFFSEQTLSGPMGKYLARSEKDSEAFATQRALQLKSTPPHQPRLLILGSSATANAIAAEEPLAKALEEKTGMAWEVDMLTTPLQSLIEQMALIETALGPDEHNQYPVIVAVGVSMSRQAWSAESLLEFDRQGRIGVRSDWADQEVAALGGEPRPRIGFYPFDNYHFVIANGCESLLRLVLHMPARRRLDVFAPAKSVPPEKRRRDLIADKIRKGLNDNTAFLRVMDSLREHLSHRPNVHLVQIEEAISPGLIQSMDLEAVQAETTAQFTAYGKKYDVPYLPIVTDAALPDSAFNDDLHVADGAAQERVREALATRIATLVAQGFLQ